MSLLAGAEELVRGPMLWLKITNAMLIGDLCKFLVAILLTVGSAGLRAAVVCVQDEGKGFDYMSGDPITLPAAQLSTNRFGVGAQCIINRPHCVKPAAFNREGRIDKWVTPSTNSFPAYLEAQQYVWFLQDARHYTNYACTVTVDSPSTFYLLVDNRVNEFSERKACTDPVFGPPDTEWIKTDGWKRVNTGLTPKIEPSNQGDYVSIDEGCNGTTENYYAVYKRTLPRPGSITLRTQFEGNFYCLVVSTNLPDDKRLARKPGQLSRKESGQKAEVTGPLGTSQVTTGSD